MVFPWPLLALPYPVVPVGNSHKSIAQAISQEYNATRKTKIFYPKNAINCIDS